VLLAPWDVVAARAVEVLAAGRSADGHVFNLGHGVLPETSPDTLARLTDLVHEASARTPA
jgi:uroporphyrinogen decarboxylase